LDVGETLRIASFVIAILSTIGTIIAAIWAWGAKKAVQSANLAAAAGQVPALKEQIDKQHAELADQRHRLREMERALAAKPTVEMVHRIELALSKLEGRIESYSTELRSVSKAADASIEACNRMEQFFVEKGIKA